MTEQKIALSFRGVCRRFKKVGTPALDRVDLDVFDGEVLSLIGSSGSGKTTLLRIAAGLDWPDEGTVSIEEEIVSDGENEAMRIPPERRRLGLVSQEGALFPHLNAEKNISYGLHRWNREEAKDRIKECLGIVRLEGKEGRFPHELSGGERQRLALARALAPQPRILLLDEPFSHLDPPLRRVLREEIRSILAELKQTALLVTHDPEDALSISERIAVLECGRLAQVGEPQDIYRFPANQYCAERFGPANAVLSKESDQIEWRRPEEARWLSCEVAGEGDLVEVISIAPLGHLWEVRVRVVDAEEPTNWLCFLREGELLKVGERGRVAWRGQPETVQWKS